MQSKRETSIRIKRFNRNCLPAMYTLNLKVIWNFHFYYGITNTMTKDNKVLYEKQKQNKKYN